MITHNKLQLDDNPEQQLLRSRSSRYPSARILPPLQEGLDVQEQRQQDRQPRRIVSFSLWRKHIDLGGLSSTSLSVSDLNDSCSSSSEVRLMLGSIAAPLAPCSVKESSSCVLPRLSSSLETSSAQYITLQYVAATGGPKVHNSMQNSYSTGKILMVASAFETAKTVVRSNNLRSAGESGRFLLWQMRPDKWYAELAVAGNKIELGSDGTLVWRNSPWLGCHTVKGPIRPLRRALQGLDPRTISNIFYSGRCVGERKIGQEGCFILKVVADPETIAARSNETSELIRHALFGYFSQRTGLLVRLEDSQLTRIQENGSDTVYWESSMESTIENYCYVDGVNIAHAGHSVMTLFRFGESPMSHIKICLEEAWTVEEVAINVQGLSVDSFIPPADIQKVTTVDIGDYPLDEKDLKNLFYGRSKFAPLQKQLSLFKHRTKN